LLLAVGVSVNYHLPIVNFLLPAAGASVNYYQSTVNFLVAAACHKVLIFLMGKMQNLIYLQPLEKGAFP